MKFYVLKRTVNVLRFETEFFYAPPERVGEAPRCPACGEYIGMIPPLPPYNVVLELWDMGFGDIVRGPGDWLLVSGRFKCLWEEHGLRGLEGFHPVNIRKVIRHKRFKGDPPAYFLVEVLRSDATIDEVASGCEWEGSATCPVCQHGRGIKRWKKHVLVPGTWKGENIFRPRGLSGSIMTDQRFADFVKEFNITNCYLIPAEEYAHDFYPWEKSGEQDGVSKEERQAD